jgi:hypothetical protein
LRRGEVRREERGGVRRGGVRKQWGEKVEDENHDKTTQPLLYTLPNRGAEKQL